MEDRADLPEAGRSWAGLLGVGSRSSLAGLDNVGLEDIGDNLEVDLGGLEDDLGLGRLLDESFSL